jgi:hypothetical protein
MEDRRDNTRILLAISQLETRLCERLASLETRDEAQKGRCDSHAAKITKIDETINGNGSLGLKTKMVLVTAALFALAIVVGADSPWVKKLLDALV